MDEPQKHYAKKPDTQKNHMIYESINMKYADLGRSWETGSRLVVTRGWSLQVMDGGSLTAWDFLLELRRGGGCTTFRMY